MMDGGAVPCALPSSVSLAAARDIATDRMDSSIGRYGVGPTVLPPQKDIDPMGTLLPRCASWHRYWLIAGICAAALLLPGSSRAVDPVAQLREALKLNPTKTIVPNLQLAAKRNAMIEAAIPKLETIQQLRLAYFLPWKQYDRPDKDLKILHLDKYYDEIGVKLTKAIRSAAEAPDVDRQLAIAILIAEIADKDQPEDKEKFARGLTSVVVALAKETDLPLRQASLSALGKITADPAIAIPVLKDTLGKTEIGPRRIAAYALFDIVKNIRYHNRADTLVAIENVVSTAAAGLSDPDQWVRAYCLQAIQESANASADYFAAATPLSDTVNDKTTLKADLQKILKTYQAVNPQLLKALHDDKLNVQLTAFQALDQIGIARAKIVQQLKEVTPENESKQLVQSFYESNDPLAGIVGNLQKIAPLIRSDDVRLRRGAIEFLEILGHQATPAMKEITQALRDSDRFVRWSAARTIRYLPPESVTAEAVGILGTMLIDPDPDLSKAAADAIEALGPVARDAVDWLGFVVANGDTKNRNWDTENRVAALQALASIGRKYAQPAIPKILIALTDPDVRLRREAAETLGKLGRPDDADLARQEIAALRKALSDEDAEVRLNASEAILSVQTPRKGL
jgi:HEAT repeat protein